MPGDFSLRSGVINNFGGFICCAVGATSSRDAAIGRDEWPLWKEHGPGMTKFVV